MANDTTKLPGATIPNVPFEQLLQEGGLSSGKMPGIVLRDIEDEAKAAGKSKDPAKFDLTKYRVKVKRFVIDGSDQDTYALEALLDACVHSAQTRIFMFDRKDSFNKEGDLVSVIYYLEPKDLPYSAVVPGAPANSDPLMDTLL